MTRTSIKIISLLFLVFFTASCEQEMPEAALEAAEGGGTLRNYTAYTIDAADPSGSNVYGRVVFWKGTLNRTLVQVSLYNTIEGQQHPALILEGASGVGTTTLLTLDTVSGDTGELNDNKFYVISDTSFYDGLLDLDAHINIYLSETDNTVVASGNIGANADPVESN